MPFSRLALIPPHSRTVHCPCSIVLCSPTQHKKHDEEQVERIRVEGQEESDKLWFTKQYVGNACGTIALFHVAANASDATGDHVPLSACFPFAILSHRIFWRTKRLHRVISVCLPPIH